MNEELIHIKNREEIELVWLNQQHSCRIDIDENAHLRLFVINIDENDGENNIDIRLNGKGARVDVFSLVIKSSDSKFSNYTYLVHEKGGATSRQLFKYILADKAQTSFRGELKILKDSQKSDASQTNRNLLLSKECKMKTQPELQIYADDVKASHGASTGELDESALFYMQQRGLSKTTARELLISAFANEVVDKISTQDIKDDIQLQVSQAVARIVK